MPPLFLNVVRYSCNFSSSCSPSKTFFPLFLSGIVSMSSFMPKYLCFLDSSQKVFLIDHTVVSLICFGSFLEKYQAAAVTPWIEEYFRISTLWCRIPSTKDGITWNNHIQKLKLRIIKLCHLLYGASAFLFAVNFCKLLAQPQPLCWLKK